MTTSATGLSSQQLAKLTIACKQPHPDGGTVALCKQAFSAGAKDATASVRQRVLRSLLLYSLLGLGVMTVASGGLGWFVSGRVLRPVRAITDTARRASDQHLGERLAPNASHELRTPLTVMRAAIDEPARGRPAHQRRPALRRVTRRAGGIRWCRWPG